eukprot:6915086-Prymnesium_polylepis.1
MQARLAVAPDLRLHARCALRVLLEVLGGARLCRLVASLQLLREREAPEGLQVVGRGDPHAVVRLEALHEAVDLGVALDRLLRDRPDRLELLLAEVEDILLRLVLA